MKKLIVGNWKMNKTSLEALELVNELKELVSNSKNEIAVCPPFTSIDAVKRALNKTNIKVGSQNISSARSGAFTGEISVSMLIELGIDYAIVGHSERRALFNETDETVNKKVLICLENDIIPIICVGETEQERDNNLTQSILSKQVGGALKGVSKSDINRCVFAYEPVWAIGTGNTASKEQADETIGYIKSEIDSLFSSKKVRVLYGGSMNAQNASSLLQMGNIDGGLIGGASLIAKDFAKIANS